MDYNLLEKKRKKHRKSNVTYTTGMPFLNMCHFNKDCCKGEKEAQKIANDYNDMISGDFNPYAGGTTSADSTTSSETAGPEMSGGEGGGMAESLLTETKRYVRRYYVRPFNEFCSNKDEVLKVLIDHEDKDCIIYTLNNLGDEKDVTKLTSKDIIYYYEDGILYDKNKVRIMDYDLAIKHEEERKLINPEQVSDSTFADVYADRMTGATELEEEINELDTDFSDIDISTPRRVPELCCICGEEIHGYGNNAEPVDSGRCCDKCNLNVVIPARIKAMRKYEK